MLEHRWIIDPGPGLHVHHRNGNTLDNSPTNLKALSNKEHRREHRKVPDEALLELWEAGMSTVAIGRKLGINSATVWRRLDSLGTTIGPRPGRWESIDAQRILALHASGLRVPAIARIIGETDAVTRRALKAAGATLQAGRPQEPR